MTWIVVSGEYESYSVLCACPGEASAKALAAKLEKEPDIDCPRAVWLPTFDASVEKQTVLTISVNLWDDGSRQELHRDTDEWWPWYFILVRPVGWRWVRAPVHEGKGGRLEVWGTNHEAVEVKFRELEGMIDRTQKELKSY